MNKEILDYLIRQDYKIPSNIKNVDYEIPSNLEFSIDSTPLYDGWCKISPTSDTINLELEWNVVTGNMMGFKFDSTKRENNDNNNIDNDNDDRNDILNSIFPKSLETIPPYFNRGLESMIMPSLNDKSIDNNSNNNNNKSGILRAIIDKKTCNATINTTTTTTTNTVTTLDDSTKAMTISINDKYVSDIDPDKFNPQIPGKSLSLSLNNNNNAFSNAATTTTGGGGNSNGNVWAKTVDPCHVPLDYNIVVDKPAILHSFTLDPFQKQAIYHLERGDSVFVAAHTSAGKTVVAEYAIALAIRHLTRAIYTSPIKALSNQKFRDFKETFKNDDIGLLTGDVQISPDSQCLIMTTEILRSMLYKNSPTLRDVEFVIFDEVHYVNDQDRGVVWEEVIIMLPPQVTLIMLSATVPNMMEFADWVGRTKKKEIFVISTLKRPVPLEHYLYAKKEMNKIVDSNRLFIDSGYRKAASANEEKKLSLTTAATGTTATSNASSISTFGHSKSSMIVKYDRSLWVELSYHLIKKNLLPVVIFTFSRKRCEDNAQNLSGLDLINSGEKSAVHLFLQKSLSCLKGTDNQLPQILRLREMMSRGIAVHHSGLLPIMKEAVEILFSRGLIKILFATETFAMGVNMPARTVVFSSLKKHDGDNFRHLLPGEYIQMAGRAGRRGIDTIGTVIIACPEEVPSELSLRQIILGTPTKLTSQFRLTFNMILNLLRIEAIRVEEMLRQSFSENITQKSIPIHQMRLAEDEAKLEELCSLDCIICEQDLSDYYEQTQKILDYGHKCWKHLLSDNKQAGKFFPIGRLLIIHKIEEKRERSMFKNSIALLVRLAGNDQLSCLVLDYPSPSLFSSSSANNNTAALSADRDMIITIEKEKEQERKQQMRNRGMLKVPLPSLSSLDDHQSLPGQDKIRSGIKEKFSLEIHQITTQDIQWICKEKIKIDPIRLQTIDGQAQIHPDDLKMLQSKMIEFLHNNVSNSSSSSSPTNDWYEEIELPPFNRSVDTEEIRRNRTILLQEQLIRDYKCLKCPNLRNHYAIYHEQETMVERLAELQFKLSEKNLSLLPEYRTRIDILKKLKYVDQNGNVMIKGRVACEINTANELITTELLFDNFFGGYNAAECVALLSSLVFKDKQAECLVQPEQQSLIDGCDRIMNQTKDLWQVQRELGLDVALDQYIENELQFALVNSVYEWALGRPFRFICELSDVLEGSIVRVIVRLDETCREVRNAARIMGDLSLAKKMEEASMMIRRDICFASSLYY